LRPFRIVFLFWPLLSPQFRQNSKVEAHSEDVFRGNQVVVRNDRGEHNIVPTAGRLRTRQVKQNPMGMKVVSQG